MIGSCNCDQRQLLGFYLFTDNWKLLEISHSLEVLTARDLLLQENESHSPLI